MSTAAMPDYNAWRDEDFRREVRTFLERRYPQELRYVLRRVRWAEIKDWWRTLHEHADVAQPERPHDRHLERRRDVLLRPRPDEPGHALRQVESDEDRAEGGQERDRAGPRGDAMHGHRAAESHSEDRRPSRAVPPPNGST